MKHRFLFRPEAEAELAEAIDWYQSRRKGLGSEFLRAFEAALLLVDSHPDSCPILFEGARRAVTKRFPYSIIYAERDDAIVVLACFHGRGDPKDWQSRVRG